MDKNLLLAMKWVKDPSSVKPSEIDGAFDSMGDNYQLTRVRGGCKFNPKAFIGEAFTHIYFNSKDDVISNIDRYFDNSGESRNDYEMELGK